MNDKTKDEMILKIRVKYFLNKEGLDYFLTWYDEVFKNTCTQDGSQGMSQEIKDNHPVVYLYFENQEKLKKWSSTSLHNELSTKIEKYFTNSKDVYIAEVLVVDEIKQKKKVMQSDEFYIRKTIDFAEVKNKCWPFAALIVDNDSGNIIVQATDCAHISPILHAESYAIHLLALNFDYTKFRSLSLYSTAECDLLSIGAVQAAKITGYNIERLIYGASQEDICNIWKFKFFDTSMYANRFLVRKNILKEECLELFKNAKLLQEKINHPHPGKVYISKDINDFCEVMK